MPIADISARLPQLARMASHGAEPAQIAQAVAQVWTQVDTVLRPVVGAKGVAALYGHSRLLAAQHHAWLSADDATPADWKVMDLRALRSQLQARSAQDALHASLEHLGQFDRLLGTLIGEALKDQLLAQAWLVPVMDAAEAGPLQTKTP